MKIAHPNFESIPQNDLNMTTIANMEIPSNMRSSTSGNFKSNQTRMMTSFTTNVITSPFRVFIPPIL